MITTTFLIICILVIIVLILYLFFWNRVIGYVLSLLVRITLWNQASSSVWIDVGSIHFSLLAGRVLFKDLRYHSSNQTIRLVKGQISWRYWIRKPMKETDLADSNGLARTRGPSSCRIHLSVQGFEWFIYNRTAAYDNIIAQMQAEPSRPSYPNHDVHRHNVLHKDHSRSFAGGRHYPPSTIPASSSVLTEAPSAITVGLRWIKSQLPIFEFSDFLPLSIDVANGAIICGNASTPNLLVAEYKRAEGTFGVVPSRSKLDIHKQTLSIKFQDALIRYAVNTDYIAPMSFTGEDIHDRAKRSRSSRSGYHLYYHAFQKLWRRVNLASLTHFSSSRSQNRATSATLGSLRGRRKAHQSMDDETPIGADFSTLEYAIERKILEAPNLDLIYYTDVVGCVPLEPVLNPSMTDPFDIGNGDLPPEWGFDLTINDGFLRYGPWADRQRVELQRAFFPFAYRDISPTSRLKPGDKRVWTCMKVFVELRNSTTLQIPFREASKDWQWDGKTEYPRLRKREAASLHVKAGENSTISFVMPMIAGPNGYEQNINLSLDTIAITSNVNDIRLLSAETCHIHGALPSPLGWNAERQWTIAVSLRRPVMYSTREHINMFTDLGKDWSSGPPTDYHRFVPTIYVIKLDMQKYEMNTYVNDHNIIDKPAIKEENALLTMHGTRLKSHARADFTQFRPIFTTVPFWVDAPDLMVRLTLPRWNTNSLNASANQTNVGRIGDLNFDGSYRYFAESQKDNVDQLKLGINGRNLVLKNSGWVVRHFMILRENYFGSFTQFSTLYEYLDRKKKGLPIGDLVELKYRPNKANVLEVVLQVDIQHGLAMLPAGLPGFERAYETQDKSCAEIGAGACVLLTVPNLQIHLRTHDYFMEMSLNADPMSGTVEDDFHNEAMYMTPPYRHPRERFFLDGLHVVANRLFGPQPRTSTYMCIWEIHVGRVRSFMSTQECRVFLAAGNAFRSNFADVLNAPAAEHSVPIDPDVTFLKVSIDAIDTTWHVGHVALQFCAPKGLRIESNDLAGQFYRKVTSVRLRQGSLKMLVTSDPSQSVWLEAAHADFDTCLDLYDVPSGWRAAAQEQAEFIAAEDAPTGRAESLIAIHGLARQSALPHVEHHGAGELYLTELQLPTISCSREGNPAKIRPVFLRQFSSSNEDSDSDSDEGIPEVMRDAHLAKSRLVTTELLPQSSDDDTMSSGDESDNEDLTEPDHPDTDWSESKESISATALAALLSKYRKYTRIYVARTGRPPSSWDAPMFQLSKDHRPSSDLRDGLEHKPLVSKLLPLGPFDENPDVGKIIIRVRIDRGVEAFVTPLIVPSVSQFLQDVSLNTLSPELHFDDMLENYMDSFPGPERPHITTTIDLSLPSIRVRFLHEISQDKLETLLDPDEPSSMKPPSVGQVNVVAMDLTGLRVVSSKASSLVPSLAFSATLDSVSVAIHTASRSYTHNPTIPFKRVFFYSMARCQASLAGKKATLHCDHVYSALDHSSPSHVIVSVGAIGSRFKNILGMYKRWSDYAFAWNQQIIRQVLLFSNAKSIPDPLSTIQPSYLIHSGRPHQLRMDLTCKFLFHLRRSLRYQDDTERRFMANFSPDLQITVTLDDILLLFSYDSLSLAVDTDMKAMSRMPLLLKLFPGTNSQTQSMKEGSDIISMATVSIGLLQVTLSNAANQSPNEFTMRSFSVTAGQRISGLLRATNAPLGSLSAQKDKGHTITRHFVIDISLGDVGLTIFPHLMDFVQQLLRVRLIRRSTPQLAADAEIAPQKMRSRLAESIALNVVFALEQLRFRAAAEKLIIEFGFSNVVLSSAIVLTPFLAPNTAFPSFDISMNHSLFFTEMVLMACAADAPKENKQNVLASLTFTRGKLSVIVRQEHSAGLVTRSVVGLDGLDLSVPRSAIRLYRFAEEWRADYLPRIEATVQALVAEMHRTPDTSIPKRPSKPPTIQVNLSLLSLHVSLQVMHGTWLSWEGNDSFVFFKLSGTTRIKNLYSFGLQVGSQIFSISSKPHWSKNVMKGKTVKFGLPMISVTGYHDGSEVHAMGLVEFFSLTSRPGHWDTFLTVQQKFGQDFNDLIALINEKRTSPNLKKEATSSKLNFSGFLKMRGFQIGLEGLSSTLLLECEDIGGGFNHRMDRFWNLDVSDLALSLAPRTLNDTGNLSFDRLDRSAFVVIDFHISAGLPKISAEEVLDIAVTKIHAVMQPSSIGEVGDFVDHLQAELMVRAEQRAIELAEFKEKTRHVMRTFEIQDKPPTPDVFQGWLSKYTVKFVFKNIGFAFPLAPDQDLKSASRNSSVVAAFLFSIRSLVFSIQRGESGQAAMNGSSFQFVSRFRQSVSADFVGENHQTRNRLLYPEMTAKIRTERSPTSRKIRISADVDGFVLDIDSCIPNYIFSLIDVYHQGKDRVDRLTKSVPQSAAGADTTPRIATVSLETQYSALPTSNILGSLAFQSGKVRLYSSSTPTGVSLSPYELVDESRLDADVDVFNLPVVSVWAEYRATPASHKLGQVQNTSSILMFKSTIYSSANAFRPTFLPFLTELVVNVENRIRRATSRDPGSISQSQYSVPIIPQNESVTSDSVSSMRISFSLRIDQSKLELTCHPDANVIAGVHWDSGGFVVNISPGARRVAFSGSVGGLTVGLKHGFLSEDCVRLDARNLAFTIAFSQMVESETNRPIRFISALLDTEFSGGVRFSRLQDVLCFKAVWLDRIPVFNGRSARFSNDSPIPEDVLPLELPAARTEQGPATIVMIHLRHVKLDVDFGQSITSVEVDFKDAVLRTKLTDAIAEFSLSVAESSMLAVGNLSGRGHVPDFLFQTRRRQQSDGLNRVENTRMLDLTMTSGPLDIVLESDHQMILQYHAEPLQVMIFDDWTKLSEVVSEGDRRLRLSFTVFGKEVVAIATVGTIPKLVSYANKFKVNLEAQREGASRESKAFRISSSPKPDNPLSDVANAMFRSARTSLREADAGLSYVIRQHMSLRLAALRLIIFPRTMLDSEMVHFIGSQVHACLDRVVEYEGLPPSRDLRLSFSFMTISKFSQVRHGLSARKELRYQTGWLADLFKGSQEAIIFGLPSMSIRMLTEEEVNDWSKTILYDFTSRFTRREGLKDQEDIYITLNVSLYSWLTVLRKNFARDMDQVQASAERASNTGVTGNHNRRQTKSPDPIYEEPESVIGSPIASRPSTPPLLYPTSPGVSPSLGPSKSRDELLLSSPSKSIDSNSASGATSPAPKQSKRSLGIVYQPRTRHIERLTMRQLGEATPDVMHPFFMKKAGFSLEDSLPQYVHEYAAMPTEEIMKALLKLYSKQLGTKNIS